MTTKTTGQQLLDAGTRLQEMQAELSQMLQLIDETPGMDSVIDGILTGNIRRAQQHLDSAAGWFKLVAGGRDGVATCEECGRGLASDEVFGQTLGMTLCGSCADERRERQWEQADEGEGGNE